MLKRLLISTLIASSPLIAISSEQHSIPDRSVEEDYSDYAQEAFDLEKEVRDNAKDIVGDIEIGDISKYQENAKKIAEQARTKTFEDVDGTLAALGVDTNFLEAATSGESTEKEPESWVTVLVSRSLPKSELKTLLEVDYGVPVRVAYQGVPDGQTINDAMRYAAQMASDISIANSIKLDPTVFKNHSVSSVPHMIWFDKGDPVASVSGISNPSWLISEVEGGRTGDLGIQGPVKEIVEPNIIDVIKERLAKIDLAERKAESIRTYFERTDFYTLPRANKDKTRYVDPSIMLAQDLKDANGNVIVPEGRVINPLAMRPFTQRLVIFNPNDDKQMDWAKSLESRKNIKDVYIATEISRSEGWDHFEHVQDALDENVYLLQSDVASRFEIKVAPSTVTAEGMAFKIKEFDVSDN